MSAEEQKPVVEEPVAAPTESTPAAAEPAATETEVTPAAAATETSATAPTGVPTTEPAATTEAPIESVKQEALKKDFAGEGTLGYKAPGGLIKKLAGFQKKFFWFGDDAVEPKHLNSYLRGEKPEIANHNAAWSSQTGKGLLYFAKHPSEKSSPAGIINLADATDITEEGTVDFFFHVRGQKHIFQATHLTERDTWVAALKTKAAEAKEIVESITSSAGYKEHHSKLSRSAITTAGAAGAIKALETKKEEKNEEKAEAKADKKEDKVEDKTDKKEEKLEAGKDRKSRSQSRKRNSIFGNFGLGKREEHAEKAEAKETAPAETAAAPAPATETPAGVSAATPLDAPAVVAAATTAPVVEPTAAEAAPVAPAAPVAAAEEPRPTANKRNSIFGSFRLGSKKPETTAATPAKETTATSTDAPVIPAPEAQEPLAASVVSPATAPTEVITNGQTATDTAKAAPETKAETPAEPKPSGVRKPSLPFGLGKKEKTEGEGEKPFFAKLRQTVKGKSSPKAPEKAAEKTDDKAEDKPAEGEAAKETPAVPTEATNATAAPAEQPIVAPEPAVTNHTTPQVSATA